MITWLFLFLHIKAISRHHLKSLGLKKRFQNPHRSGSRTSFLSSPLFTFSPSVQLPFPVYPTSFSHSLSFSHRLPLFFPSSPGASSLSIRQALSLIHFLSLPLTPYFSPSRSPGSPPVPSLSFLCSLSLSLSFEVSCTTRALSRQGKGSLLVEWKGTTGGQPPYREGRSARD